MVILIGAESCSGKTIMAQKLLETYKMPYLCIDHLKMGLFLANPDCGFSPSDDNETIEEKLWHIIKNIIEVNIENGQNIIIEGCYLFPQRLNEFDEVTRSQIIPVFFGFSEQYIRNNFSTKILEYKGVFEKRDKFDERPIEWFVGAHKKLKNMCEASNVEFYEIKENYELEVKDIFNNAVHKKINDCFPLYRKKMQIGEVCLLTNDVIRLADFYKTLFSLDNNSNDETHQFIFTEETTLTIYNDGIVRSENNNNICLAFTVDDVDLEFERLKLLNVEIISPPTLRPWGAKNMTFKDPDGNIIAFRTFPN